LNVCKFLTYKRRRKICKKKGEERKNNQNFSYQAEYDVFTTCRKCEGFNNMANEWQC